jgi:hypothetical protein
VKIYSNEQGKVVGMLLQMQDIYVIADEFARIYGREPSEVARTAEVEEAKQAREEMNECKARVRALQKLCAEHERARNNVIYGHIQYNTQIGTAAATDEDHRTGNKSPPTSWRLAHARWLDEGRTRDESTRITKAGETTVSCH